MRQRLVEFRNTALRTLAVPGLALLLGVGGAIAQSGDLRAQDQSAKPAQQNANPASAAEAAARDSQRKSDEFAEAAKAINGPAGNPECVWLGRRVVALMWRDDLDTAFRHLDLYDRFGCPGGHVQATFRCLVRFGAIDPKVPDSLNSRVHACWINPGAQPPTAAAAAPAPATPAASAPPAAAAQPAAPAAATPAPAK
ncbi:MAG: beta-1-3, beta-1-6-glucan biosynthesis protein [Rhizobiales bacterium 62-47]|nr:beta-1-3, beta-1-6-glucan biosynthesis protein [Hyphomicrobiales bacterium]OJY10639.1 MAG: beta-1-3, beta-1-6-glucan biosynthesis protein [Rhizobiales bacterium 62-47]